MTSEKALHRAILEARARIAVARMGDCPIRRIQAARLVLKAKRA